MDGRMDRAKFTEQFGGAEATLKISSRYAHVDML